MLVEDIPGGRRPIIDVATRRNAPVERGTQRYARGSFFLRCRSRPRRNMGHCLLAFEKHHQQNKTQPEFSSQSPLSSNQKPAARSLALPGRSHSYSFMPTGNVPLGTHEDWLWSRMQ